MDQYLEGGAPLTPFGVNGAESFGHAFVLESARPMGRQERNDPPVSWMKSRWWSAGFTLCECSLDFSDIENIGKEAVRAKLNPDLWGERLGNRRSYPEKTLASNIRDCGKNV
jgi:hypothetical protein